MTAPEVPPLTGFAVGVTAARKAAEQADLLQRRGARVQVAPAMRIVALPDDTELRAVTRQVLATPPDVVVVNTGDGFRGWLDAAREWDLGPDLLGALGGARVLTRGPKARGAVRGAGLTEAWSPDSESSDEVLEHLLGAGVDGLRVAVQLHGDPLAGFRERLDAAGAEVLPIPVYRWEPPADTAPLDRLVGAVLTGEMDAVTFTSAPAAAGLLAHADATGCGAALVRALSEPVLAVCVGSVTAKPLTDRGVPVRWPQRARTGDMVRLLGEELSARAVRLQVPGHLLELRGHAVLVDGEPRSVPPALMAVLRALAARPGRVLSRAELLDAMPGPGDDLDVVDRAVARLRTALDAPDVVEIVDGQGFRLAAG